MNIYVKHIKKQPKNHTPYSTKKPRDINFLILCVFLVGVFSTQFQLKNTDRKLRIGVISALFTIKLS